MGLKWPLWWRYSDDTKTMLHEGSGDSVRLLGATPGLQSGSLDGLRLKLEYSDGVRQHVYPVTVDVRALPRDAVSRSWGNVTNLDKELTGPVHIFRVSFDLANRAWQARSPVAGKHLPYGIWRRLEEHVTDALLCWPGAAPFDGNARLVTTREGWNNGEWRSNYYRVTENCPVKFPAGAASLPHYPDEVLAR